MVYIERVSAMPGQGVTGMLQFGRSLGIAEGVVAALGWPITYVSSAVWKKASGIRVGAGKDDSRAKACQLLPLDAATTGHCECGVGRRAR
jgi:crossover junction endodeoxyribonuclease RuvC